MYKYSCFLMLPLFLGCNRCHNIPEAELSYIDIKQEKEGIELYAVRFSSNMDLLHIFKKPLISRLDCSLDDEVPKSLDFTKYMAIGQVENIKPGSSFIFSTMLSFNESLREGRSRRILNTEELKKILSTKQAIPCIYKATAFGYRPYFSGVLWIPTADILREVEN